MTRHLRPLIAVASAAAIGLLGSGCGSTTPPEAGAAGGSGGSASSNAASSTTAGSTTASAAERRVKFAQCIRGHGVPDFPDANAKGEFVFGINVSPEVWSGAVDACKALQPPGSLSSERSPKQQTASLTFAQCVRRHGVKDFPDPANGDPLIDTTHIPSSNRPGGMTILNAAIAKCRGQLEQAAAGR